MTNKIINLEKATHWRLYSDMHEDFYVKKKFDPSQLWEPEVLPEDSSTVLILAGDIWHAKKYFTFSNYSWLEKMSKRFKYVLVVLGNHDFWGGQFPTEYDNFEKYKKELNLNNIFLLQDSIAIIGDYKIIGSTLWTSLGDKNLDIMEDFEKYNNDLKYIRWKHPLYPNSFKKFNAKPYLEANIKSKNFIFENAKRDYPEQKVFVVTHHPPTAILNKREELTEVRSAIDFNHYDKEIPNYEIDVWMHGHNHDSGSAKIGNTEILANTVGYVTSSSDNERYNYEYNPWFQRTMT